MLLSFLLITNCTSSDKKSYEKTGASFHIELSSDAPDIRSEYVSTIIARLDNFLSKQYSIEQKVDEICINIPSNVYSREIHKLLVENIDLSFCLIFEPSSFSQEEIQLADHLVKDSDVSLTDIPKTWNLLQQRDKWLSMEEKEIIDKGIAGNYHVLFKPYRTNLDNRSLGELVYVRGKNSDCFDPTRESFNVEIQKNGGVSLFLKRESSQYWADFTTKNINKNIAVTINKKIVSLLNITSPNRMGKLDLEVFDRETANYIFSSLKSQSIKSHIVKNIRCDYFLKAKEDFELIAQSDLDKYKRLQELVRFHFVEVLQEVALTSEYSETFKMMITKDFIKITHLDAYEFFLENDFDIYKMKDFLNNIDILESSLEK